VEIGMPSILLVDDNEVNQKVVLNMLDRLGYFSDLVETGVEALIIMENQHYDVILMDIVMPEMDGLKTTMAIRARWPPFEQPYIIAITTVALSMRLSINKEIDDYLCKPFAMDELRIAINKFRAINEQRSSLHYVWYN
jgi:CheY-like chemotaxis protein